MRKLIVLICERIFPKITLLLISPLFIINMSFSQETNISNEKLNLNIGNHFLFSNNFSSNLFFIQPYYEKPINKKFSLLLGTSYVSLMNNNMDSEVNTSSQFLSFQALGKYQASDRLILFGGISHTEPLSINYGKKSNMQMNSFFGGFDYQISNNTTIGASFSYSKGYYQNPFLYNQDPFLFSNPYSGFGNNFMFNR